MDEHSPPLEELLDFPCDYVYKAFGLNEPGGVFQSRVRAAVARVVPVSLDAMKVRPSSQGKYLCVSVIVRLQNLEQVQEIDAALRQVEGLKYLL